MIGLSWPLWVDGGDFPRIPFVRGWAGLPGWASWAVFGSTLAALAGSMVGGRAWRWSMGLALALLAFAIVGDQDRLQPWAYQYLVVGLALVAFPPSVGLRLARLYAVSLYFYSGLSKLDASFVRELGPTFLAAGLSPIGLSAEGWSGPPRTAAILAMPAFEVAVGLCLCSPRARRLGLAGAVGLHATLIAILGPWGLGHSPNVLIWNGAMIVEDLLLFGADPGPPPALGPLGRSMALAMFVFPIGERFGLADSWPSHALYASHCERTEVFVLEGDLDRFPGAIRRRVAGPGDGPWLRLDLTGWSRDVRGTPLYPQGRVGSGVGEFLADRFGAPRSVRVIQWSRADPWDGRRDRVECLGLRAIRRRGDRFWINAHPSGRVGP